MSDNSTANDNGQSWWEWWGNAILGTTNQYLQSSQAVKEQKVLAEAQAKNEKLSFLGMQLSKETLLWIAGGSILAVVLVVLLRRK